MEKVVEKPMPCYEISNNGWKGKYRRNDGGRKYPILWFDHEKSVSFISYFSLYPETFNWMYTMYWVLLRNW